VNEALRDRRERRAEVVSDSLGTTVDSDSSSMLAMLVKWDSGGFIRICRRAASGERRQGAPDMLGELQDGVLFGGPGVLGFAAAADLGVSMELKMGGREGVTAIRLLDLEPFYLPLAAQRSKVAFLRELCQRALPWEVQLSMLQTLPALKSVFMDAAALTLHHHGYSAVSSGALTGARQAGKMLQVGGSRVALRRLLL
jgi:hypothetical protein